MIEALARFVIYGWEAAGMTLFFFCWFNALILPFFLCHRLKQLRHPNFELCVTAPTHTALHFFCAGMYGIVLPSFYFLTVRTRH